MRTLQKALGGLTVIAATFNCAGLAAAAENKPRVAIVDFEALPGGWTLPPPQIGATVAQLMLDKLVGAGEFHVLDGQWLLYGGRDLVGDRRFAVLRDNAEQAGVDYLIVGAITKFSNESKNRTIGGGGFHLPIIGGFRRQKNDLAVSLTVRVVDVKTGEVVATSTGQGTGTRKNIGAGALGFGGVPGAAFAAVGAAASRDAQLDEALQGAVATASKGIVGAASKLVRASSAQ